MIALKYVVKDFRKMMPCINFVGNRTFKSRNPPEPHYDRKLMVEVCKPINLPNKTPPWENCAKNSITPVIEPHPYEKLLAQDLKKLWDSSKMVLFYHLPPLKSRVQRGVRNAFFKENLHFQVYSPHVVKLVVEGTPFKSVLHLFESSTAMVFSDAHPVNKALAISRKVQVHGVALMAGIIDGVFYSKGQLQAVNELLKRDSHQELAQFLSYVPSKINSTINHHTQLLSHYLTQVTNEK